MNVGGGLPWPAKTIEEPPRFTLLGNGLAIYSMTIEDADGRSRNELHRAQLDDAQVDALLYDALGTGGLAAAQEQYRDIDVYDAGTTRFEIHAGGIDKAVSVYALGIADVMAPSRFERIAFSALASRLGRFEDDLVAGRATDSGLFAPEAYRVTLAEPLSPATRTEDWPWRDLVPADFTRTPQGDLVKTVTASQGEAVLALGYEHDLVLGAPDGGEIPRPHSPAYARRGLRIGPAARIRARTRGDSSAGRASAWHAEGPGFEPPSLHHSHGVTCRQDGKADGSDRPLERRPRT